MDDATGDMNVNNETAAVAAHFRARDQFFGLPGSLGEDQET
jgi:hypothetical protein